jgi:hypothetical protein
LAEPLEILDRSNVNPDVTGILVAVAGPDDALPAEVPAASA